MDQINIVQLGFVVVFIGILIIISSMFFSQDKAETRFSVFGIFGFIPFGFSNDRRLFILSIVLTSILVIFSFVLFYRRIK